MCTITQEKITDTYTCQNCAKTFNGDTAHYLATEHVLKTKHRVLGKRQYLVEIKP